MDTRPRIPWWLVASCGVLAFTVTVFTLSVWRLREDGLPDEEMRMLRLVYRQVMKDHVDAHDGAQLMRDAIAGLVDELDDYSAFVPPEKVKTFDSETTGEYEGIGITMVPRHVPITVHYPMVGGPAERAGLRVGDRIVGIDGADMTGLTPENVTRAARERLLGEPGSKVALLVERPDGAREPIELTRGDVQRPSVKWVRLLDRDERIGYVHVAGFQHRTAAEFDEALAELEATASAPLGALIVDLRFNLGGLLTESVAIANRFLRSGNIVSLRSRNDVEQSRFDVDPLRTTHPDLPLVLLVNEHSASASEVLCGALQDHGRAVVVGQRTWGKGVVQSIYRWEGLDFRLKLTTSRYYTPNGRNIGRKMRSQRDGVNVGGIPPDVDVALPEGMSRTVRTHLANDEVPRRYKKAAAALTAQLDIPGEVPPLGPEDDPQLGRALEVARERVATPVGAK